MATRKTEEEKCKHRLGNVRIWRRGDGLHPAYIRQIKGIESYINENGIVKKMVKACHMCDKVLVMSPGEAAISLEDYRKLEPEDLPEFYDEILSALAEREDLIHYKTTVQGMLATDRPDVFEQFLDSFDSHQKPIVDGIKKLFTII